MTPQMPFAGTEMMDGFSSNRFVNIVLQQPTQGHHGKAGAEGSDPVCHEGNVSPC
jgi:hypothetical protein